MQNTDQNWVGTSGLMLSNHNPVADIVPLQTAAFASACSNLRRSWDQLGAKDFAEINLVGKMYRQSLAD
jgi:hypothetical protein